MLKHQRSGPSETEGTKEREQGYRTLHTTFTNGESAMKEMRELRSRAVGWTVTTLLAVICWCTGSITVTAQPGGSPCDSVAVSAKYVGPGCCWEFVLRNGQRFQPFNSVTATVLTPSATVTGASGGFPATTTAISANWAFPNNLPPNANTTVQGCFSSASGVLTLVFEWKDNGRVICRDTVTVDCPGDPPRDTCDTDSLLISTGWNHATNSLDPVGGLTTYWTVESDPDAGTTEPRPAGVINKYPSWANPLPGSQWISAYPTSTNYLNGTYMFKTCFCVKEGARNVRLNMRWYADDSAAIFINGSYLGSTPLHAFTTAQVSAVSAVLDQYIKPGRNCIEVRLINTNSIAMGLNIAGWITADGIGLERSVCCDVYGSLTGAKFQDLDCDGKRDPNEPGLPGWTIQLSNGQTAVTDALGNYYFNNLPPGTYTINEVNQPGWTQSYPAAPGTHTVTLASGQATGNLDFGNCKDADKECFEYRPDTTFCEQGSATGGGFYIHKFRIRSLLPCQFTQSAAMTVLSPAGVNVSPATFPVSGSVSGQTISFNGPGAVAGATVLLQIRICCVAGGGNGRPGDTIDCCYDTVRIVLPDCPTSGECKDCCKDFRKKFDHLYQWSSSNGFSTVGGILQAGNTQICTVSATLVDVRINGNPVYGSFVPTNILGGNPGTIPYMHEVIWTGTDVSAGPTPFVLQLKFPPVGFLGRSDNISYCVRFRFTDRNCVTCDTVICFKQKRQAWIFPFPGTLTPRIGTERKGASAQGAAGPTLSGVLTGEESGRLSVTFPEPPAEFGAVRFVGLGIYPAEEFVEITGATSPDYSFTVANFGATASFEAEPGASTAVDLEYFGLNNRARLDHRVVFRFVFVDAPNDTLEESGIVTFYRQGFEGGDELEKGGIEENATTFALYLHNRNGSEEQIGRLVLQSEEGVKILAVGPGSDERQALLNFADGGDEANDAAGIDLSGAETPIAADGTVGPIYVTLSGFDGSTDLAFVTLNGAGNVITEGTLTLTDNPSSVHTGEAGESAGGMRLYGGYPNPAGDGTTIRFRLGTTGENVILSITDAGGREVERLLNGEILSGGEHAFWFDTKDLPNGNYFVTLRTGNAAQTERIQIMR